MKKLYWLLGALPMLFLPMSILAVMMMISTLKYGSVSTEFWMNFSKYHLVFWLVLFYPIYYVLCWRKSSKATEERRKIIIHRMTITAICLTVWAAGTTYAIDLALKKSFM